MTDEINDLKAIWDSFQSRCRHLTKQGYNVVLMEEIGKASVEHSQPENFKLTIKIRL